MKILLKGNVQLLIVILLTALAYSNIYGNQFVDDDVEIIQNWDFIHHIENLSKIFSIPSLPYYVTVYRPLSTGLMIVLYQFFGPNPFGYHIASLLIHLGSTVLVYFIVSEIVGKSSVRPSEKTWGGLSSLLPFVVALIFGFHPVHTESITYIAASMDTFGFLFYLGAFLSYTKSKRFLDRWYQVAAVLAALAIFTYEGALSLVLLLFLYDVCFRRLNLKNYIPFVAITLSYFFVRFVILDLKVVTGNQGYLFGSFYKTMLVMIQVYINYIKLLIFPLNLATNPDVLPGIQAFVDAFTNHDQVAKLSLFHPRIILNLLILGLLMILGGLGVFGRFGKSGKILGFGIGIFFISLAPVSSLVPQYVIMQERYLYLGVMGFGLVVAYLVVQSTKLKVQSLAMFLVIVIALAYGVRTYVRNFDWHDKIILMKRMADYELKDHIMTSYLLAELYQKQGSDDQALNYYQKVLDIEPQIGQIYFRIGQIYQKQGKTNEARQNYYRSLPLYNNFVDAKPVLDELRINQDAGAPTVVRNNINWKPYLTSDKLLFYYPENWKVTVLEKDRRYILAQKEIETGDFEIELILDSPNVSIDEYLSSIKFMGEIQNEGLAQIPGYDKVWVRIYENSNLEFYLFRNGKVVRLLVSDANDDQMSLFDQFLGSVSF